MSYPASIILEVWK